jgi:ElaB/YqjD/DUF883 family membrane-anchored ribosome-binding protein
MMTTIDEPERTERGHTTSCSQPTQSATARLREQAQEVTKDLQKMGNIASDAVEENLGQMRENASEYYEHGRDGLYEAERTFEQFIRDRPIKSILIAAGVGLFLGRFWRRR